MPNILTALLVVAEASSTSIPAVHVTAADIQATLENAIEIAPGMINSVALLSQGHTASVVAGTIHSGVTEVYTVLEGAATMGTGGRLIDPRPRGSGSTARRDPGRRGQAGRVPAWKVG